MDSRVHTALVENYALLLRVSFVILVIDIAGISAWVLRLFESISTMLPPITTLQLSTLVLALLLLMITLDIGRPTLVSNTANATRWSGVTLLAAAAATIFGVSPLIYEGIRITLHFT